MTSSSFKSGTTTRVPPRKNWLSRTTLKQPAVQCSITTVIPLLVSLFVLSTIQQTSQQQANLCPRGCKCDDAETRCNESIGAAGLPHVLNPSTKSLIFNNAQTSMLSDISYLVNLESLDLAHNKLTFIDFNVISKHTKLNSFNVSHNTIYELRDSYNGLSPLSPSSYDETTIDPISAIYLDLSHNVLTSVRNYTFLRWNKLITLDLSYNHITTLDSTSLLGLIKLENLNLKANRLVRVPTIALFGTTLQIPNVLNNPSNGRSSSLSKIDLSENTLVIIGPDSFNSLEHVHELYLDSCSISVIHELAFKGLNTLYLLSLESNHLDYVPKSSFPYIGLLRSLKLNSNRLKSLTQDSFVSLTHLEELQINNGTFSILERGVFNGLGSLKRLEVGYNSNLTIIEEGTFEELIKLTYLSLYSNALTVIYNDFSYAESLGILDVRGNKLSCECPLKWMTRWLKKLNTTIAAARDSNISQEDFLKLDNDIVLLLKDPQLTVELVNVTCVGPPALKGKLVVELPENKLECLEPTSELNVHIGFALLFIITFVLTFVCMVNLCRNKKDLLFLLKENIVQNHISMMTPYSHNLHKNSDDLKRETHLYGGEYESVDYNQARIYTVGDDMYYGLPNTNNA